MPLPAGTVTFLFTDIEGSASLWEQHSDAMQAALARHDALLQTTVTGQNGAVVKTTGDGCFAAFHTAPEALAAALDIQQAFRAEDWPAETPLKVRAALHTGAAEQRDNDYFGTTLNRTARLLSIGHGGQTLLSAVTQELVRDNLPPRVTLASLGEHRLKDLQRPETVYQLQHPDLAQEFPPLRSLNNPALPNNLPQQTTSFIGREAAIQQVKGLLEKTRLLTLTGSGGCGKTRLSLQVAAEMLDGAGDGVWLVELASLADPALVPQTVANVLGVKEEPGTPLTQTLADYLKPKRMLILLDNCEHLVNAAAQLADALLKNCPNITLLATSREALNITGETQYGVPSLSLPPLLPSIPSSQGGMNLTFPPSQGGTKGGSSPSQGETQGGGTLESLSQFEAVRLFIERATLVQSSFAVTNDNAPALAQLCVQLDGIPLAIELAAARVRSLPVKEINARLDNRFRLLTGGSRAALPRQQTLRALIDWSYDLLNAQEKALFCRLSVFAGGWTLEAAEAIGPDPPCPIADALPLPFPDTLVPRGGDSTPGLFPETAANESEKGMGSASAIGHGGVGLQAWEVLDLLTGLTDKSLVAAETGAVTRYRLLETMKQYAAEKLREGGQEAAARHRHLAFYLALGEEAEAQWRGPEAGQWLNRLETEHANLRAALSWALEDVGSAEAGLRLGAGLRWFWFNRGFVSEGLPILTEALTRAGDAVPALTRAKAFNGLGFLSGAQGDLVQAKHAYERSLALHREAGNLKGAASLLNNLGTLAQGQGDGAEAKRLYEEALALKRSEGIREGQELNLNNLAWIAIQEDDCASAQRLAEEALLICRKNGNRDQEISCCLILGSVAKAQERGAAARHYLSEALTLAWQLGHKPHIVATMELLANLFAQQGATERAAQLWGAVEAARSEIGMPMTPHQREGYERHVAEARQASEAEAFAEAWAKGAALSLEQAIELTRE